MSGKDRTLSATEFKATCLRVFDDLEQRRVKRVIVTRRGKQIALITAAEKPKPKSEPFAHGFLKDRTLIPKGLDLTEPVLDEPLDAHHGIRHR